MKNLTVIYSVLLLIHFPLFAQEAIVAESEISEVVVYTKGALVSRAINTASYLGEIDLVVKGLPTSIRPKSITAQADASIEIISISSRLQATETKRSSQSDSLTTEIKLRKEAIEKNLKLHTVLGLEKELLKTHNNYSDEQGRTDITAVIKASDFYRVRLREILLEQLSLEKDNADLDVEISKLRSRLQEIHAGLEKKETQIRLKLNINQANADLTISYFLPEAKWYSYYDLKVDNLSAPIKLLRKAFVSQTTGEDWDKVKLSLSNANPTESNKLPHLAPYLLDGPRAQVHANNLYNFKDLDSQYPVYGLVLDATGLPLIGANMIVPRSTISTITDVEGRFYFDQSVNQKVEISYVGYNSKTVYLRSGLNIIILDEAAALLDEVVVTGTRAGSAKRYRSSDQEKSQVIQEERKEIKQVKVEALTSVEYKIAAPYSIKSEKQETDVLVETSEVSCSYKYHSVPGKIEKAFLVAEIPDWHKLDLLPGKVNLFLSNTFKGESYINPNTSRDTLSISLGADPEVIVEKTQLRDLYSKKFLNKSVQEKLNYVIEVKNNKTHPITLKIIDQIPVSNNKAIKIELLENNSSNHHKDTGILEWEMKLNPGERKEGHFNYKVRYPKNYKVIL